MNLEEQLPTQTQVIIPCCGTCAYWRKTSEYEGVCTEGLSGTIDTTEVRWSCMRWTSLKAWSEQFDDTD